MTRCTAPRNGHKRGSLALFLCPVCGPRGRAAAKGGVATPSIPIAVPNVQLGDEGELVRRGVVKNPSTSDEALKELAADESQGVRRQVAANPHPMPTLYRQSTVEGLSRRDAAGDPNTSAAVLDELAGDENGIVRSQVAGNPNAPAAALERLAKDEGQGVRWNVAANPNAPAHVTVELMGDTNPYVADAARDRFALWAQETLNLDSAPTERLLDMLVTLKAWELDPKDPAVVAAVALCN